MSAPAAEKPLPPLKADPAFYGILSTQFLGAFNDNVFKQLLLLICVDVVAQGGPDLQGRATTIFALPFLLGSGFAGWLSDRVPKRALVVIAKLGELLIMFAGMAIFLGGGPPSVNLLYAQFVVLAFMSVQSTFFGPPKYGILPETFRAADLPAATGLIQMTTFLAIIFGTAVTGVAMDLLAAGGGLWKVSAISVAIAAVGVATAFLLRRTPTADPDLPFDWSALAIHRDLWPLLGRDATLRNVLIVQSAFFFVAAFVQLLVNPFGKLQLGLSDTVTSLLLASIAVGIAVGSVIAGRLSGGEVRFGIVRAGTVTMAAALAVLVLLGELPLAPRTAMWLAGVGIFVAGIGAGLFAIPLGVVLQTRPPRALKGRMIGAMNVGNWTGIVLAGLAYDVTQRFVADGADYSRLFGPLVLLLIPIAIFYRPRDYALEAGLDTDEEPSRERAEASVVAM